MRPLPVEGAGRIMVVDTHPDRLRLAEKLGAIPIDASDDASVGRS